MEAKLDYNIKMVHGKKSSPDVLYIILILGSKELHLVIPFPVTSKTTLSDRTLKKLKIMYVFLLVI